jgi:hypothetical protein
MELMRGWVLLISAMAIIPVPARFASMALT